MTILKDQNGCAWKRIYEFGDAPDRGYFILVGDASLPSAQTREEVLDAHRAGAITAHQVHLLLNSAANGAKMSLMELREFLWWFSPQCDVEKVTQWRYRLGRDPEFITELRIRDKSETKQSTSS